MLPLRQAWRLCLQCAVIGLFGPVGRGGHSTDEVRTSLSSDSQDLATDAQTFTVERSLQSTVRKTQ